MELLFKRKAFLDKRAERVPHLSECPFVAKGLKFSQSEGVPLHVPFIGELIHRLSSCRRRRSIIVPSLHFTAGIIERPAAWVLNGLLSSDAEFLDLDEGLELVPLHLVLDHAEDLEELEP